MDTHRKGVTKVSILWLGRSFYTVGLLSCMRVGARNVLIRVAYAQLSRFQVGSRCNVTHVRSRTRPSPFSACNIENVGVAWGRG